MKFKDQVASAAKKANTTLGMRKRNVEYINKDTFEVLYIYGHYIRLVIIFGEKKLEQSQTRAPKLVRNYDER